jgi:CubicO group peptidase (beta-lactamase class C family)
MNFKNKFLSVITSFFLLSCNSTKKEEQPVAINYALPASIEMNPELKSKLSLICSEWYNQILKKSGFSGGILVSQHGNTIFEKYEGRVHLNNAELINNQTSLHIASVSKTFTAMAVLKLCQDKLLNLDDPLSKYFNQFNYPGVTIRTLLNHRSGLPNYVYFMDELGWNKKKYVSNQDVLDALIKQKNQLQRIEAPNRRFCYCNTNYVLLALLIEKITNTSFSEHIKKTIFVPLQMNQSFVYSGADSSKANPSFDPQGRQAAFINLDKVVGDKNIFSTPEDLLKWDRLLSSKLYLNDSMLQQAYQPYSNEHAGIRNYGLGWRMYNYPDGYKIIYHNGWWHGSNAVFIRLVKEDATIIVIGNKYNSNIYKARDLISLFIQHNVNVNEND